MNYYESTQVRMFPTSKRSATVDINSRMHTEHNLINIINRLTGKETFVVDGLEVNTSTNSLESGSCNLHGYIFYLDSMSLASIEGNLLDEKTILALQIKVNIVGDNEEIMAHDGPDLDANSEFKGIALTTVTPSTPEVSVSAGITTYTLALASWEQVGELFRWETIYANDGSPNSNRINVLTHKTTDILMTGNSGVLYSTIK